MDSQQMATDNKIGLSSARFPYNARQLLRQYALRILMREEEGKWEIQVLLPAHLGTGERKRGWRQKYKEKDGPRVARKLAQQYKVPRENVTFVEIPIWEEEYDVECEDGSVEAVDGGTVGEDGDREEVLGSDA